MLLEVDNSCLLLVDVQERLAPFVQQADQLIENCRWVLQLANTLTVPILVSEQYPKGLGATVQALQDEIQDAARMEKVHFSCAADPQCLETILQADREQIIITGIEAHVCVMQTALDLLNQDKQVFVVADAISARNADDVPLALQRMRSAGVQIISQEMILFEWARQAGTPEFKKLQKIFLK